MHTMHDCRVQLAMIFWAIIVSVLAGKVVSSQTTNCNTSSGLSNETDIETVVDETLKLISWGDENIALDDAKRDIVLVAGLTGAGKSTITKFITGKELESYKKRPHYLIKDKEGKISISTIISTTILPDMYLDEETQTVYYDLPGFSDTRNASVELANAWFMKKVADHAERVKIIFIVSFSEVTTAGSRTAFKTLLEHAVKFISEPSKFSPGIALIASKVPPGYAEEDILEGVGEFLLEVKQDIANVSTNQATIRKATHIIDTFLTRSAGKDRYERIGYFQQPTMSGKLSSIPTFPERRSSLKDLIENRLKYVEKQEDDFAISASDGSKYYVKEMLDKITVRCESLVSTLASYLRTNISVIKSVGHYLVDVAKLDYMIIQMDATTTREAFIGILEREQFAVSLPNETIRQLKALDQKMDFYEEIVSINPNWRSIDWAQPFKLISPELQAVASSRVRGLNDDTEGAIIHVIASFGSTVQENGDFKMTQNTSDIEGIRRNVEKDVATLRTMILSLKIVGTYNTFLTTLHVGLNSLMIKPVFELIPELENDIVLRTQRELKTDTWVAHIDSLLDKYELQLTKCSLGIVELEHRNMVVADAVKVTALELKVQRLEVDLQNKAQEVVTLNSKYLKKLRKYASNWQKYYNTLIENV